MAQSPSWFGWEWRVGSPVGVWGAYDPLEVSLHRRKLAWFLVVLNVAIAPRLTARLPTLQCIIMGQSSLRWCWRTRSSGQKTILYTKPWMILVISATSQASFVGCSAFWSYEYMVTVLITRPVSTVQDLTYGVVTTHNESIWRRRVGSRLQHN